MYRQVNKYLPEPSIEHIAILETLCGIDWRHKIVLVHNYQEVTTTTSNQGSSEELSKIENGWVTGFWKHVARNDKVQRFDFENPRESAREILRSLTNLVGLQPYFSRYLGIGLTFCLQGAPRSYPRGARQERMSNQNSESASRARRPYLYCLSPKSNRGTRTLVDQVCAMLSPHRSLKLFVSLYSYRPRRFQACRLPMVKISTTLLDNMVILLNRPRLNSISAMDIRQCL